ncbi:hypothetical protein MCAG_01474 [Micromonospora sp. ATCC 39149]|nr:hypothetical protein MCAG_01474 [Micromonospora sp. ATCC 39149]
MRHGGGETVHLGYCTNVHPAEDLAGILAQLDTYAVPVRRALDADPLGLGLWLAAPVAAALAADEGLRRRLRAELTARGLEVVTLNGFPYAAFQAPVVKHAVYHPDWTTPERLAYTLDLARVLADLLPADAPRGSVSTLPLAWRTPWDAGQADAARRRLDALERRAGRDRAGHRPGSCGRVRTGAGLRGGVHRPGRRPCSPAPTRNGWASCLDLASPGSAPGRNRPPPWAGSPPPGCRW